MVMCALLLMSHDFPALATLQNVLALARCCSFFFSWIYGEENLTCSLKFSFSSPNLSISNLTKQDYLLVET